MAMAMMTTMTMGKIENFSKLQNKLINVLMPNTIWNEAMQTQIAHINFVVSEKQRNYSKERERGCASE